MAEAEILKMGTLFPEELIPGMMSKVTGRSAVARLTSATPQEFTGTEWFTFQMENAINLIGESDAKPAGGFKVASVKTRPYKVEYGGRVSDEFMIASTKRKLELIKNFNEGFSKKLAEGLDIMAIHAFNPRTEVKASQINHYFDEVTKTVNFDASAPDDNIEDAVEQITSYSSIGVAMSRQFSNAMAKQKNALGDYMYPQFRWGGNPDKVNGVNVAVGEAVKYKNLDTTAIVGDFENGFRWGYSMRMPMEVIQYGDPDGTGRDLKNHNEVYLRLEAYIGFAVMDDDKFVRIVTV